MRCKNSSVLLAAPPTTTPEPICYADHDCNEDIGECCSVFGHCGTGPEFCWSPSDLTTHAPTQPTTTGMLICDSDVDCPPNAPCCSMFGHCGNGPEFCTTTSPEPETTTAFVPTQNMTTHTTTPNATTEMPGN